MGRQLLLATALSVALLLAGCRADSVAAPPLTFVGRWNLRTVNTLPLPFVVQSAAPRVEVMDDQIIVTADGAFTETFSLRITDGTLVSTSAGGDTGVITRVGSALSLSYADGVLATGSLTATTLTLFGQGFTQVFERSAP